MALGRFRGDATENKLGEKLAVTRLTVNPRQAWEEIQTKFNSLPGLEITDTYHIVGGIYDFAIVGKVPNPTYIHQLDLLLQEETVSVFPALGGKDFDTLMEQYEPTPAFAGQRR